MTEFLTAKDIAKRYQISLWTVYALVRNGKIPCGLRVGRSLRWPLEQIEEFEKQKLGFLRGERYSGGNYEWQENFMI